MLERRDFLAGIGCVAALGAAEALRPRRVVTLMPKGTLLKTIVPRKLPGFDEGGTGDIVIPRTEGTLSSRLYSDQLARVYQPSAIGAASVMLLIAYGPAQTDLLQVHRPEVCYPAIGFAIANRYNTTIADGPRARIPAVALTARAGDRVEDVIYWTRVGRDLPRTFAEQSWDRLRESLRGEIGDGALVRGSAVRDGPDPMFGEVTRFLEAMVAALPASGRPALTGRAA